MYRGEKLVGYDPRKGGQLVGPVYKPRYHKTSLCVQLLIDEHEQEHLDDKKLQGACDKYMKAKAAKDAKATKKTRPAYEKAKRDYDEARRKSECAAYKKDLECIKKLKICCQTHGKKKTKKKGKGGKGKGDIYCCLCKDVKEAETEINEGLKANRCKKGK